MIKKLPSSKRVLYDQILYHTKQFIRMPRGIISAILIPILILLALYFAGGRSSGSSSLYIVAGAITLGITLTAYESYSIGLLTVRDTGVLKRLHGTPIPLWCYFVGRIIATIFIATFSSVIALIVARFLYPFNISSVSLILLFVSIVLGSLTWTLLGTAITGFIKDTGTGQSILIATYLPIVLLSGIFFPLSSEPSWMQIIAKLLPAQPLAHAIQLSISYQISLSGIWLNFGVLIIWSAIGFVVAIKSFRWE